MINRNDIAILVNDKAEVWVAQGTPAYDKVAFAMPSTTLVASESGLYYSQLEHRAVVRLADGSVKITTLSKVPKDARNVIEIGRPRKMTTNAAFMGRI
jgi:hypothetical protein